MSDYVSVVESNGLAIKEMRFQLRNPLGNAASFPLNIGADSISAESSIQIFATTTAYEDGATVGIGAGQMSRVDSTRIAARKALDMAEVLGLEAPLTQGSVVASDAFFPFADGLITAFEAGATALIQPGGSMRDDEVIAAADAAGLAMVFTGMRHFRH